MTRYLIITLMLTLARALLAHGCGELVRIILARIAPTLPPLVAVIIGLVLGVVLVEAAAALWRRRKTQSE